MVLFKIKHKCLIGLYGYYVKNKMINKYDYYELGIILELGKRNIK
jgi:hypothetical protein